jgi:PTS system nitrogen regulatory IIA component
MDLNITDVAELLDVSELTIQKWLASGKIPAYRINQQYQFSRTEIEDWVLAQKRPKADEAESPTTKKGTKQFSLFRAIHKGGVFKDVPGNTKEEVIRNTTELMAQDLNLDPDVLADLLLDREKLMPTALNHGVAVPHARDFFLDDHQDVVTVVFPEKPLHYGALDGKPVHTLFFLFACEDKRHLNLLAKIAHLTDSKQALNFLETKPSKEAFLQFIKDWETNIKNK